MDVVEDLTTTLEELVSLFRAHGETHWSDWIAGDLKLVRNGDLRGIEHLLSAYGGMGSLPDRFLCPENGDRITEREVNPVNEKLRLLVSRAYDLARQIERTA